MSGDGARSFDEKRSTSFVSSRFAILKQRLHLDLTDLPVAPLPHSPPHGGQDGNVTSKIYRFSSPNSTSHSNIFMRGILSPSSGGRWARNSSINMTTSR